MEPENIEEKVEVLEEQPIQHEEKNNEENVANEGGDGKEEESVEGSGQSDGVSV